MFSIQLKKIRENAGYSSQQSFADAFGVAQSTVGGWEAGKREPNFATIIKLADFFDVTIDYLLGKEKNNTPAEVDKRVDNGIKLTDCEIRLIHLFRKLDVRNQSATFSFINSLYETQPGEKANLAPKEA